MRRLFLDGSDGPWVRGRIERVFRVQLPAGRELPEKTDVLGKFVAVLPDVGVPFCCRDYYLRTGLFFSGEESPALCDRIASAFWGLLLSEPHDLPEYRDRMFHYATGCWLCFGIVGGQPFVEEHDEEPDHDPAPSPRSQG